MGQGHADRVAKCTALTQQTHLAEYSPIHLPSDTAHAAMDSARSSPPSLFSSTRSSAATWRGLAAQFEKSFFAAACPWLTRARSRCADDRARLRHATLLLQILERFRLHRHSMMPAQSGCQANDTPILLAHTRRGEHRKQRERRFGRARVHESLQRSRLTGDAHSWRRLALVATRENPLDESLALRHPQLPPRSPRGPADGAHDRAHGRGGGDHEHRLLHRPRARERRAGGGRHARRGPALERQRPAEPRLPRRGRAARA